MKLLKSKSLWIGLSTINIMSALICAFCGSLEGSIVCLISVGACMVSYNLSQYP